MDNETYASFLFISNHFYTKIVFCNLLFPCTSTIAPCHWRWCGHIRGSISYSHDTHIVVQFVQHFLVSWHPHCCAVWTAFLSLMTPTLLCSLYSISYSHDTHIVVQFVQHFLVSWHPHCCAVCTTFPPSRCLSGFLERGPGFCLVRYLDVFLFTGLCLCWWCSSDDQLVDRLVEWPVWPLRLFTLFCVSVFFCHFTLWLHSSHCWEVSQKLPFLFDSTTDVYVF